MSSKAVPVEEDIPVYTSISIGFMFATTGSRACARVPKHQPFFGRNFPIVLHLLLKLPGYAGSQSHSWGSSLCHSLQSSCTLTGCFLKCPANIQDLYNSHEPEFEEFAYVIVLWKVCCFATQLAQEAQDSFQKILELPGICIATLLHCSGKHLERRGKWTFYIILWRL